MKEKMKNMKEKLKQFNFKDKKNLMIVGLFGCFTW